VPARAEAGREVRLLVAVGDSFTAGHAGVRSPWPEHAARTLGCRHVNLAVEGARSAEVEALQLDRAIELEPDLLSVICGANDVLRTTRPDTAAFSVNFNRMLARVRAELPDAVLVTATFPGPGGTSALRRRSLARVAEGIDAVNAAVRRLARIHGAICLELDGYPADAHDGNLAADGFHPSEEGHRRFALRFATRLSGRAVASATR